MDKRNETVNMIFKIMLEKESYCQRFGPFILDFADNFKEYFKLSQ